MPCTLKSTCMLTSTSWRRVHDLEGSGLYRRHSSQLQRLDSRRWHWPADSERPHEHAIPCKPSRSRDDILTDPSQAQVITNIATILEEAGTSWDFVLKTTIFLASMDDYAAVNEVYGEMLPDPKPARTAVEVGKLPGNFLVEIEAIAAIPDC
jgi:reactive intermediate/imine deaminase